MLTLQIKEKEIENLTPEEEFVRGTVGAKCQINFDEFWQSYNKYIVFKRVGYEPINFMVDTLENEIEIPYTILAESGEFKIGVFGITETETLPTLYSKDIKILYGTDTHGTTPPTYIPSEIDQLRLSKQDKLVSGENIKTVNGESVLGSGNIEIQVEVDQTYTPDSENAQSGKAVSEAVTTEQKRTNSAFANALKGTKSGTSILIDDISPITHEIGVKVKGKNLFDEKQITGCIDGDSEVEYSRYGEVIDGCLVSKLATYDRGTMWNGFKIYLEKNETYTLSADAYFGTNKVGTKRVTVGFIMKNSDGTLKDFTNLVMLSTWDKWEHITTQLNVTESGYYYLRLQATGGAAQYTDMDARFKNIQVEIGTNATAYTPYADLATVKVIKKNGSGEIISEHTPNADGTVEGITSLYPVTVLSTDTDGVLIDCEYNKDINKFSGADVDVPTKTSELINDSNFATQDYVDEEIANFDFIKIVTVLPETGLVNRTYFVPKEDPNTNDLYDEYMWVDGKWELITTKQIEVDLTNYYTKSEVDDALARVTPTIKTVMDEVAIASTQYYLGEVTELNITLPEDAETGQEITVAWYNGGSASTLAIDGNMLDFDYIPEANTRSEINALWDGTYWSVIGMSQEVPIEVTV